MGKEKPIEAEIMPEEVASDSDNVNNPFCYNATLTCPCKLNLPECLIQNSKANKNGNMKCPHFFDNHTPRQEYARNKCIVDLKQKVKFCNSVINATEQSKKVLEKSTSYGCVGCGCLLGASFIMVMAGCGLFIFKWACEFVIWAAGKF